MKRTKFLPTDYMQRKLFFSDYWKPYGFLCSYITSDEVYFNQGGYVKKQNCRYWAPVNLRELHQELLYSEKVTVGCTVLIAGVIVPYFYKDGAGLAIISFSKDNEADNDHIWFLQDEAIAHTARVSTARNFFFFRVVVRNGDVFTPLCLSTSPRVWIFEVQRLY